MAERRRYKKSEITRKRLIDAALQVFAEKGYSKARITDITKKVGLTHAAFYAYFKDKDDLILSLITSLGKDFEKYTKAGGEGAKSLRFDDAKSLKKAISDIFSLYRNNLTLHAAFMEGAMQDEEIRALLHQFNKDLASPIIKQVREYKKSGRCEGWNPELVGRILILAIGYMAVASELGLLPASRDATVDNLVKILYAAFNYKK
jgi:AcrR family transcriptional regulator